MNDLKKLGLVVLSAMAFTAILGFSSASAATKFTASKVGAAIETVVLQQPVFTVTGAQVKCTDITFTGSSEALESTAQMVVPRYEGCAAFGLPATVTVENCTYNLTATGQAHLEPISAGKTCNILANASSIFGECLLELTGPQTLSGVSYANDGASAVDLTLNFSGISDHVTKSSGVCPLSVGTHTNATTTAQFKVTLSGAATQVD